MRQVSGASKCILATMLARNAFSKSSTDGVSNRGASEIELSAIHMHHIIMEELGLKLLNNLSVSNNSEFSCNLSTTCMTCIVVTILSCALHVCTCTLGVMTTLSIFRFPFQLSVSSVYTCPIETWKQYVWQQRL